jgi:uncharacterized protein YcaQ
VTLDDLRRAAVARSLFRPTTLQRALDTLGFVQADPIRAPARAQDLTLRHRVIGYRAGDLERLYPRLAIHEDFFVNYGFVTSAVQALMHPRGGYPPWTAASGRKYAPLPAASLATLVRRLRYAVPQWTGALGPALERARRRLVHARVDGVDWYWPEGPAPAGDPPHDMVRLLAPFDPVVWDRRRFEILWGWPYRFEAYTPLAKRKLGYYALPLLWGDRVIGWGNLSVKNAVLQTEFGYLASRPPRGRLFRQALDEELDRIRRFMAIA